MSLENLLKIGRVHTHEPSAGEVRRLLSAADRNLRDAEVTVISFETRFDAAYKAIMQAALVALLANGYRPSTSEPGHHMTILQSLPKTIGLASEHMILLDALRKRRNLCDYMGMNVDTDMVSECIDAATRLLQDVSSWLSDHRPDLLDG